MTPYDQIKAKYDQNPQDQFFEYYLTWHHRNGFVFSTPDFFIMGRAVDKNSFDPTVLASADRENQNAWYIHAMAGNMARAWDILPYPLGYVGWERIQGGKRDLRWYRTEDIRRLSRNEPLATHAELAELCV